MLCSLTTCSFSPSLSFVGQYIFPLSSSSFYIDGLLLIGVSEVKRDDIADNNAADIASSAETMNSDSDGSTSTMNIWAVAAVAALGAMFLVIILCTSILYCDWRKRKLRRERKREERAHAMQMAAIANANGSMSKKSYSAQGSKRGASNNTYVNLEIDNMEAMQNGEFNQPALQIVVPHVASGDTQEIEVSPSTQGSGGVNNNNVDSNFQPNAQNASGSGGGKGFISKLGVGKSRRSLAKSKAASAQLQEADQVMSSPTSSGGGGGVGAQGQNNQNAYTDQNGYIMNQQADVSVGDGYSVGEDTTMLYPTINRGRTMSKDGDGMSDFDGYSMDGMSAMDGGYSQFGGSGNGGSGVHSSSSKKKNDGNRDMYYTGEVPRDFDSVWGDDDQSKITMDGEMSVDFTPAKTSSANNNNVQAYADLTQNLNQLVEQEYEQDNASSSNNGSNPPIEDFMSEQSGGLSVNLHDFDSESESGSKNFTLELLGKKSKVKLGKSTSAGSSSVTPSVDDEDSILGDMYKDETSELGIGGMGDDISAIEGVDEGGLGEDGVDEGDIEGGEGGKEGQASDDVSVDSTPSWAAPIQTALRNSMGIFRTLSKEIDSETNADTPAPSKDEDDDNNAAFTPSESQEQRTKDKFMSGLIGDDSSVGSVGSNRSRNSNASSGSRGSHKSSSSRKATTAKSSTEKALGLTNSMEEEVDEDPAAMIDNINSMLSECRTILDTEKDMEP